MSEFLYFLPGATGDIIPPARLRAAGLGYAFPVEHGECPHASVVCTGPEGARGSIVAWGQTPLAATVYAPEKQFWQKLSEGAWIGCAKEPSLRPISSDLLRGRTALESHPVELGDGGTWHIPIVRRFPDGTALPRVLMQGPDGKVVAKIRRDHEELFQLASCFLEDTVGETQFHNEAALHAAQLRCGVLALAVNYRVSSAEVSALELLDTQNARRVAEAVMDWPNVEKFLEEFKKKRRAESTPGRGS